MLLIHIFPFSSSKGKALQLEYMSYFHAWIIHSVIFQNHFMLVRVWNGPGAYPRNNGHEVGIHPLCKVKPSQGDI